MSLLHQLAEEIIWAPRHGTQHFQYHNNQKNLILLNLKEPPAPLIQAVLSITGYAHQPNVLASFNFGLYFTDDPHQFFTMSSTRFIQHLIYVPETDILKVNGALKKTLWQCLQRIGMI